MPSASHPQAKFDPIPPDLDLSALVENTSNFDYVIRISTDQIHDLGLPDFEKLVLLHVIIGGRPLVIEGWSKSLPPWLFSPTWLLENLCKKQENVRDIGNDTDLPMTVGHYLSAMEKLTEQCTPTNYRDSKRQRLYLKDVDCPEPWHKYLESVIPQTLFYLNDCVGEKGGPGAIRERNMYNQLVLGKGLGPAGDLMSSLPPEMRAENLMCYIGHEGTYTPAHREMCASLGQNIMVEASTEENGEKPGSSIWFMTESKDREVVSEYFLSMLGHDIEVESHFAQINAWKKAPFPVYILEQKAGDFVLIPPLAPHQVWNRGTRTMKVAWNRTTVETLELALHEAIPRARMVCRDEQYKNKAIVYYSLLQYHRQLRRVQQTADASLEGHIKDQIANSSRVKELRRDFNRLFALYTEILVSEMFSPDLPKEKEVEFLPFDSNVTCSYCRCNIFNRFLTCKTCISEGEDEGEEDTYDICMECYAMGRSCGCISNLKWVEQWKWSDLTSRYDEWRAMVAVNDGLIDNDISPPTLDIANAQYGKKPVAQICQEELKRRPWKDITQPLGHELSPRESEAEPEINNEGYAKKKKVTERKSQQLNKDNKWCHICQRREWNWKLANCTTCLTAYCYGVLWRAFDLKPQTVMENVKWQCPRCLKICSCGKCRKDPTQQAYRPKGTLLGHDTRRVADPRSLESLVDFSRTNLTWLRDDGDGDPHTSLRMQKLVEKAQTEKARDETLGGERRNRSESQGHPNTDVAHHMAIDPVLFNNAIEKDDGDTRVNVRVNNSNLEISPSLGASGQHQAGPSWRNPATTDETHHSRENGHDSYGTNGLSKDTYEAPEATMFVPEDLTCPNPSPPRNDRMVGVGYYQQSNDADEILFEYPESNDPNEYPDSTYPRLPQEAENATSNGQKRKREILSVAQDNDDIDPAHSHSFQAQKKQKLVGSSYSGTRLMTQVQPHSDRSLAARLPTEKSNDFLQHLEQAGGVLPKHHPRSTCTQAVTRPSQIQAADGVGPATLETASKSIHEESGDDGPENIIAQNLKLPFVIAQPPTEAASPMALELPPNSEPLSAESGVDECQPEKPLTVDAITKETTNEQRSPKLLTRCNEKESGADYNTACCSSSLSRSPRRANAGEVPSPEFIRKSHQLEQNDIVQDQNVKNQIPHSSESPEDDEPFTFVDDDDNLTSISQSPAPETSHKNADHIVSEDNASAEEQALAIVEADLDEGAIPEEDSDNRSQALPPVLSTVQLSNIHSEAKAPQPRAGSIPKPSSERLLSMAQRQALKGKSFKIIAARSKTTHMPTSTSSNDPIAKSLSTKPSIVLQSNLFKKSNNLDATKALPSDDDEDDNNDDDYDDDDDDESIPAARPVAKKPQIEALVGHNMTTRRAVGMLDSTRARKPSARIFR